MFAKLKQKVILVDDGSNSNGVTKESVVPGRILKRNTAEKGLYLLFCFDR